MTKPSKIEIIIFSIVTLLFIVGVYIAATDDISFKASYVNEDGFIEWLTVVGLLCSMSLCLKRLVSLRAKRNKAFIAVLALLSLFFFFGAGEEISWGQRIIGVESPDFFKENNAQSETNLHNLVVGETKINKLVFGVGFALILLSYLGVVTPLYHKNMKARSFFIYFGVPIPRGYHIVAYVVFLMMVELVMESSKKGEMTEFAGSFLVFMNLFNPYNKHIYDPAIDVSSSRQSAQ